MEKVTALQSPPSLFKSRFPLSLRIWHWLTFLLITLTIIVVLLASTVFLMRDNTPMVQAQIERKGGTVTPDQAKAVAHEYSDKLWMLHKYIGYGLCILMLWRIILESMYSGKQRLAGKIKKAAALQPATAYDRNDRKHYLTVKWVYVVFYILFLIMALTGLGLAYEDVPFLRANHGLISDMHSVVQYLIYIYILVHIAGVVRADLSNNKGIVSAMINGGEEAGDQSYLKPR